MNSIDTISPLCDFVRDDSRDNFIGLFDEKFVKDLQTEKEKPRGRGRIETMNIYLETGRIDKFIILVDEGWDCDSPDLRDRFIGNVKTYEKKFGKKFSIIDAYASLILVRKFGRVAALCIGKLVIDDLSIVFELINALEKSKELPFYTYGPRKYYLEVQENSEIVQLANSVVSGVILGIENCIVESGLAKREDIQESTNQFKTRERELKEISGKSDDFDSGSWGDNSESSVDSGSSQSDDSEPSDDSGSWDDNSESDSYDYEIYDSLTESEDESDEDSPGRQKYLELFSSKLAMYENVEEDHANGNKYLRDRKFLSEAATGMDMYLPEGGDYLNFMYAWKVNNTLAFISEGFHSPMIRNVLSDFPTDPTAMRLYVKLFEKNSFGRPFRITVPGVAWLLIEARGCWMFDYVDRLHIRSEKEIKFVLKILGRCKWGKYKSKVCEIAIETAKSEFATKGDISALAKYQ